MSNQIAIVKDGELGGPVEYFCWGCGQLRISYVKHTRECGGCGSVIIEIGAIGSLDKDDLKMKFENQ